MPIGDPQPPQRLAASKATPEWNECDRDTGSVTDRAAVNDVRSALTCLPPRRAFSLTTCSRWGLPIHGHRDGKGVRPPLSGGRYL